MTSPGLRHRVTGGAQIGLAEMVSRQASHGFELRRSDRIASGSDLIALAPPWCAVPRTDRSRLPRVSVDDARTVCRCRHRHRRRRRGRSACARPRAPRPGHAGDGDRASSRGLRPPACNGSCQVRGLDADTQNEPAMPWSYQSPGGNSGIAKVESFFRACHGPVLGDDWVTTGAPCLSTLESATGGKACSSISVDLGQPKPLIRMGRR